MHTNGGHARSIDVIVCNSHKELPWETRHYIKLLVKFYRCKYLSCSRYFYVCLFSKELK